MRELDIRGASDRRSSAGGDETRKGAGADAPRIVATPLPWFRYRVLWAMYTGALGLIFGTLLALELGTQNSWLIGIGFGLLVAAVFACALGMTTGSGESFATEAVMIMQTRASGGGLFVQFIGTAGASQITFTDEHDPDFVKLWQRWNHPHPRSDLPLE